MDDYCYGEEPESDWTDLIPFIVVIILLIILL